MVSVWPLTLVAPPPPPPPPQAATPRAEPTTSVAAANQRPRTDLPSSREHRGIAAGMLNHPEAVSVGPAATFVKGVLRGAVRTGCHFGRNSRHLYVPRRCESEFSPAAATARG